MKAIIFCVEDFWAKLYFCISRYIGRYQNCNLHLLLKQINKTGAACMPNTVQHVQHASELITKWIG
jgi:hypothetical protein